MKSYVLRGLIFNHIPSIIYKVDIKIMPNAILIGFEYTVNSLIGTMADLTQAYKWCRSFGCVINILTDINHDRLINAMHVKDSRTLTDNIVKILNKGIPDGKLIIYYSGHGLNDSMVLPDRTLLPFVDFRDIILNNIQPYVEIFWVLDCCNPNGLHLPYKLEGNRFVLSPDKIQCVTQPILLITSSEAKEKSIATKTGSVFTLHLFRLLTSLNAEHNTDVIPTSKNRNLRRLIGNLRSSIRRMYTGYEQTVSIYSSYVVDPILWMWIGSNKKYDIVSDMSLSTLIVRQDDKDTN